MRRDSHNVIAGKGVAREADSFPKVTQVGRSGTRLQVGPLTQVQCPLYFKHSYFPRGSVSSFLKRDDWTRTIPSEVPYRREKFIFVIHSEKLSTKSSFLQNQYREPKIEVWSRPEPLGAWATGDAPHCHQTLCCSQPQTHLENAHLSFPPSVLSPTSSTPFFGIMF